MLPTGKNREPPARAPGHPQAVPGASCPACRPGAVLCCACGLCTLPAGVNVTLVGSFAPVLPGSNAPPPELPHPVPALSVV